MIEDPGESAGSSISIKPALGPELIIRRSFANFASVQAISFTTPDTVTAVSLFWNPSKTVLHRLDLFAVILRNKPVKRFLVPRRGGESGSDRGAAHHDLKALGADVLQLPDEAPES